jgi:polyferredoxin
MKYIRYLLIIILVFGGQVRLNSAEDCSACAVVSDCAAAETSEEDEFTPIGEDEMVGEESAGEDEFAPLDESEKVGGEDEFAPLDESEKSSEAKQTIEEKREEVHNQALYWALGALAFTALAGVFVRFPQTRKFRYVFLIGSLIVLGFYRGGCPCPISSFQNLTLAAFGVAVPWQSLIWFIGVVLLTYLLGQVWCGWVCHLGAFQDMLFKSSKFDFLRGEKAQKVMHGIRYFLFAALIVQLAITQTNLFIKIDPFKVAFNFISVYTVGWVLLGLLILSSIFIYRPFCRSACPVGLVDSFISKIPGASVLGVKKDECTGCRKCSNACESDAIIRRDKYSILNNEDCFCCGECLDSCPKNGLEFHRKSKKYSNKAVLNRNNDSSCDSGQDGGQGVQEHDRSLS